MKFDKLGPTGSLITGSVLDCSRKALERVLRDYDSQLYVKWNPKKKKGFGCWEVRRRPETKTAISSYVVKDKYGLPKEYVQGDVYEFEGMTIFNPKYHETNGINFIFDVDYLNYDILTKLKIIDTWGDKYWANNFEYEERVRMVKQEEKTRAEAVYNLKQYKPILNEWKEMILSGRNPAEIAKFWGKGVRK